MTEPKTIAELTAIHGKPTPEKPLRVRERDADSEYWLDIIAVLNNRAVGWNSSGRAEDWSIDCPEWLLVEPEPEYETRYAYFGVFPHASNSIRYLTQKTIDEIDCPDDWQKLPEDQFPPIKVRIKRVKK